MRFTGLSCFSDEMQSQMNTVDFTDVKGIINVNRSWEVMNMMYSYMTLADETEIVHSQIIEEDGKQKIFVHFERPTDNGFDSARCELPDYKWLSAEG